MPSKKKNNKKKNKNVETKGVKKQDENNSENQQNGNTEINAPEVNETKENFEEKSSVENYEVEKNNNEKTRVDTRIFGEEFSIIGDLEADEIKRIAGMVDDKMRYVNDKYPKLSYHKVAILAALNIAEEYVKLEEEYKELIDLVENHNEKSR